MLRHSLTARLVLLLTLSIGLVLMALSAIEYFSSRQDILDRVDRSTQRTIEDAAKSLANQLATIEETTKLLAEILVREQESEAELVEILRQAIDERSDIFGGSIALDPRWTSRPRQGFAPYFYYEDSGALRQLSLAGDYDYTARAWYRYPRDRREAVWSEPYFDEGGANILMATYSVPMFRHGEEFYGVVTTDIALSAIQKQISGIVLGDSGFSFLVSFGGNIIAGPNPEELLHPLLQVLPLGENLALWVSLINTAKQGTPASSRLPCHARSGTCMLKVSPLQTTGWPLGVYYSEQEMLQPLRDYFLKLAGSTALTLLLLSLIVTVVSRRITKPLGALARASGKVAAGDFSTPMPPTRRTDEVGRLVNSFATMQSDLQSYIAELRKETASRNRLEGELSAAREIQMAMLPAGGRSSIREDTYQLWARLEPAKTVGGDLYNYFRRSDGKLLVAVGDVSDKGVPAALFMSRAMSLLQQKETSDQPVSQLMAEINNGLTRRNENCMFLTLFLGLFNPRTLQLDYCSAGHTAPSLLRAGSAVSLEPRSGPALGLASDLVFEDNHLQLQSGDLLAVYTDGIDEAFNREGEQFGVERFNRELELAGPTPLPVAGKAVLEEVDRYAGEHPQSDDITLLLLRLPGPEFTLKIDQIGCGAALTWLGDTATTAGLDAGVRGDILLLAEETLTNIEKYAGLEAGAEVSLALCIGTGEIELRFCDAGEAFDPLSDSRRASLGENADDAEIGGLGVHLLEAISDWQEYRRVAGYNLLRLGKKL